MSLYIEVQSNKADNVIIDLHRFLYFRKSESSIVPDCICSIVAHITKEEGMTIDFRSIEERDMLYDKIKELLIIHI